MLNQEDFKKLPIFIISMDGKVVITTNFSEDIASFVDSIYLANNHEEFLKMIPIAILGNSLEKNRHDLMQHRETLGKIEWRYCGI